MARFCAAMKKPCMANLVPAGGKTPVLPYDRLEKIGYKLGLFPVMLLSTSITAMQTTLEALRPGASVKMPPAVSFTDLQSVVGFPAYWDGELRYQAKE